MAFIDIDLDSTPSKFEQVPAGVYVCTVEKAEKQPTKDGSGQKIVVEMKIADGPMTGRTIFDHIGLKGGKPISLKRLMLSAGMVAEGKGVDLNDLLGKTVKVRTKTATYTDDSSGEVKETTRLADYLIEGEPSKS